MRKLSYSNQEVFSNYDLGDFSKLMFDAGCGEVKGITLAEANDKIREVMFSVCGIDESASRKEIRKAMRRHKLDIYEVTEDFLDELVIGGFGDSPFYNEFLDAKFNAEGDMNTFIAPDNSILTVAEVSGGHHDTLRQKLGPNTVYSVKTQWYAVKIYTELELFLAGRIDWAKFVQKIYQAFDLKIAELICAAFEAAGSSIPNNSQFVKSGSLVLATMLTLIEDVQAANPGKEIVIMGTKAALAKLNDLANANWISTSMKEDNNRLGHMAIWQGVRLVEIPQAFKAGDTSSKVLSSNKLVVMPIDPDNKMLKFYDEGEAQIREITDGTTNMDMTLEYEYQRKMGAGVVFCKYFGVYTITG